MSEYDSPEGNGHGDRPTRTLSAPDLGEALDPLGEALLEAAVLETRELDDYLRRLAESQPTLADTLRRRLEAVPAASFLEIPAAGRLEPAAVRRAPWERSLPDLGRDHEMDTLPAPGLVVPPHHDVGATDGGATVAPGDARPPDPGARLVMTRVSERYALGECLGEGGMARVFRAFDHKLSRSLAFKFLTRDEPAIVHRFLREARLQAQVQHDHVLDVYDSGELDGRPYIAMRYVEGCTLGEIREHTSLEEQVRLLIQVAEGLDAAHREGLIHRDVKPSNVLVEEQADGGLRAYVADFGIASEPTGEGDGEGLAGTPSYIAPELLSQPRGPVDRRTDVYSLGVTCYELFTGRRPYATADPLEVIQERLRSDPPPPRELVPALPADLEAIVLRAMAREPEARYPSARAMADDLRRFLSGEVVEAYTATLAYRATRFVLRHRLLVVVAGVALVALLAASVAVTVFALRAERERARAEARRNQAEALVHFMVVDLRDELREVGRLDVLDGVHEAALDYFAAVSEEELSDDELARQSQTLYQIGEVRIERGDLDGAVTPFEESLALARSLSERHPDDGQRLFELGQSWFWLGYVRWRQGQQQAAWPCFSAYREIAERLVAMDPENTEWRRELSYAHSNLGSMLVDLGRYEEAHEQFEATLAIDRAMVEADPSDPGLRVDLSSTYDAIAEVSRILGRLDDAQQYYSRAVEVAAGLVAEEPANPERRELLGTSLEQAGTLLRDLGKYSEAEEHFNRTQKIFAELVMLDEENSVWRYKLAWSHLLLGLIAHRKGEPERARREASRGQELLASGVDRGVSDSLWRRSRAISRYFMGLILEDRGRANEEIALAREELEALHQEFPTDYGIVRWLAATMVFDGRLAALDGRSGEAEHTWRRALEVLGPQPTEQWDGRVLATRAEALVRLGRPEAARAAIESLAAQGYVAPGLVAACLQHGGCGGSGDRGDPGADQQPQ